MEDCYISNNFLFFFPCVDWSEYKASLKSAAVNDDSVGSESLNAASISSRLCCPRLHNISTNP